MEFKHSITTSAAFMIAVFIQFVSVLSASATDYYVSNSGDDADSGTISDPFKTVSKLLDIVQPGDIGYIRGGTYALKLYCRENHI